jgi:hypothetical protein
MKVVLHWAKFFKELGLPSQVTGFARKKNYSYKASV